MTIVHWETVMKHFMFLAALLGFGLCALAEEKKADEKVAGPKKPQVQVCFVLDTTGSMGGLIEGAKAKIWTIANQIVKQKPTPEVKIALIGYRDRGDQYITKLFDLTDDIDAVFKNLTAFNADGGGDEPESVNQALDEAVNKISWSADRSVLKVIFLVGDAPPHMNYKEKQYSAICKEAVKKDLIINTIQCGNIKDTTPIWREIAKSSEGEYAAIAQDGNMAVVAAPQDKELGELNAKIGGTLIPVALKGAKWEDVDKDVREKQKASEAAPASVAADRRAYLKTASINSVDGILVTGGGGAGGYGGGGRSVLGDVELIDQINSGAVKLADLKDEQLPPAMRKMTMPEREVYVAAKQKERAAIQAKIAELNKARMEYIDAEKKKQAAAAGKKDSFDDKVAEIINKQAEAKRK
jgi:uncharacterized protein YegL